MAREKRSAPRFGVYRPGAQDAFLVPGGAREQAGERIRVATWNIHFAVGPTHDDARRFGADHVRATLSQIAQVLNDAQVDVVALQEVDRDSLRTGHVDQLEVLREATGLRHASFATTWDAAWIPYPPDAPLKQQYGRMWSGQAVLSRFPILTQRRHALPQPKRFGRMYNRFYLHRCIQEVTLDLGAGRRMTVLNSHLEPFDKANRRGQGRALSRVMARTGGLAVSLGDLNTVPPEATQLGNFVDEPQMEFYGDDTLQVLRDTGWTELGDGSFTFPASAPTRRLDHILVSPGANASGGQVVETPASDHLCVVAELQC